jgi:hypothetical protein
MQTIDPIRTLPHRNDCAATLIAQLLLPDCEQRPVRPISVQQLADQHMIADLEGPTFISPTVLQLRSAVWTGDTHDTTPDSDICGVEIPHCSSLLARRAVLSFPLERLVRGSNRHEHPLDPPGYWTRHVGKVIRVIGGTRLV